MKLIASTFTPAVLLFGVVVLDNCHAWSPQLGHGISCHTERSNRRTTASTTLLSSINDENVSSEGRISPNGTTRRDTLANLIGGVAASTAVLSTSTFGLVGVAHADAINKVASSTALRALTRARAQLPIKLLPAVKENDFASVKVRLREPPFDTLRKSSKTLVAGAEGSPLSGEVNKRYNNLIFSLERFDSTASLGFRGRSIGPLELTQRYDILVKDLDIFMKVAAQAAEIPLEDTNGAERFVGTYTDPINHPGGKRTIKLLGKKVGDYQLAEVQGGGGRGEPANYVLPAVIIGDRTIVIDFSPKGGPRDFAGVLDNGDIKFVKDGNRWPRQ